MGLFINSNFNNNFFFFFSVPDDLTPEEQKELENIRRRKQELLDDIQVIRDRIRYELNVLLECVVKALCFQSNA